MLLDNKLIALIVNLLIILKCMEKKYQTTQEECQNNIIKGNVCGYCGLEIVPIETVNNSGEPTFWSGCMHNKKMGEWGHFSCGYNKEMYDLAYKIILDDGIYLHMEKDATADFEYQFMNGVNMVCGILRNIEFLKNDEPRKTKQQLEDEFIKFYKNK
jgi:hypothetical protein